MIHRLIAASFGAFMLVGALPTAHAATACDLVSLDPAHLSCSGNVLTVTGGQVSLTNIPGSIEIGVAPGAGLILTASQLNAPVRNDGTVKVAASSVSCVFNTGTAKVLRSTVSGGCRLDESSELYGIRNTGSMVVVGSTVSRVFRTYNFGGAGVYNAGKLRVLASTIARNSDYEGGAGGLVSAKHGSVKLTATILAGNGGIDCFGTVHSGGYVQVGTTTSCDFRSLATDRVGPDFPKLQPFGSYGGPTMTLPPKPSSPAVDAIPIGSATPDGLTRLCPASGSTDQRGFTRPIGPACDIGAVELGI